MAISPLHICQRTRLLKMSSRVFRCSECSGKWQKHTFAKRLRTWYSPLPDHPVPEPYLHR